MVSLMVRLLGFQLSAGRRVMLIAYLPVLLALCVPVAGRVFFNIPVEVFTSDPAMLMNTPIYVGAISNFGILLWSAAIFVCGFTLATLRKAERAREIRSFLLWSCLVTLALLLDDAFLLHERIYPRYLHISREAVYVAYIFGIFLYLFRFLPRIIRTDFVHLFMAFGFLALSVSTDAAAGIFSVRAHYLWEDGFKLLGIAAWLTYFTRFCLLQIREEIASRPSEEFVIRSTPLNVAESHIKPE